MPVQIYSAFSKVTPPLAPHTNYYALVPPTYKWKGHSLNAIPPYAYGASELKALDDKLGKLYRELAAFRERFRMFLYRP